MARFLATTPLLVLLATACTLDRPTAPAWDEASALAPGGGAPSLSVTGSSPAFFSPALEHLATRVLGGFSDAATAAEVRTQLQDLDAALAAGDSAAARAAIRLARQAIDPKGDGAEIKGGDRADVNVILLVLEQLEQTIG